MITNISNKRLSPPFRVIAFCIIVCFLINTIILPTPGFAQTVFGIGGMQLPIPGTMVHLSSGFQPPLIRGLTIHPENPLEFDFIIDRGQDNLQGEAFEAEANKLIKYFMASLTIPEEDLWVNLSPYEKDRIIPEGFGVTEMGRDLLAQDYILKQLSASLMYPENDLGKEFWSRVHTRAEEEFGTTDIPTDTFNKIWIVPEKAVIYVNSPHAFVVESRLDVMLEEDYEALRNNAKSRARLTTSEGQGITTSDNEKLTAVLREIIVPEIKREVNVGKNFAPLRQIYHSLILAAWYKKNLQQSLLSKVYVDQNKTKGVDIEDKQVKQKIYAQYLKSLKKGVYNFIKQDYDSTTQEIIPRKYFSGGFSFTTLKVGDTLQETKRMTAPQRQTFDEAQLARATIDFEPIRVGELAKGIERSAKSRERREEGDPTPQALSPQPSSDESMAAEEIFGNPDNTPLDERVASVPADIAAIRHAYVLNKIPKASLLKDPSASIEQKRLLLEMLGTIGGGLEPHVDWASKILAIKGWGPNNSGFDIHYQREIGVPGKKEDPIIYYHSIDSLERIPTPEEIQIIESVPGAEYDVFESGIMVNAQGKTLGELKEIFDEVVQRLPDHGQKLKERFLNFSKSLSADNEHFIMVRDLRAGEEYYVRRLQYLVGFVEFMGSYETTKTTGVLVLGEEIVEEMYGEDDEERPITKEFIQTQFLEAMSSGQAIVMEENEIYDTEFPVMDMIQEILSTQKEGKVIFNGREIEVHPGFRMVLLLDKAQTNEFLESSETDITQFDFPQVGFDKASEIRYALLDSGYFESLAEYPQDEVHAIHAILTDEHLKLVVDRYHRGKATEKELVVALQEAFGKILKTKEGQQAFARILEQKFPETMAELAKGVEQRAESGERSAKGVERREEGDPKPEALSPSPNDEAMGKTTTNGELLAFLEKTGMFSKPNSKEGLEPRARRILELLTAVFYRGDTALNFVFQDLTMSDGELWQMVFGYLEQPSTQKDSIFLQDFMEIIGGIQEFSKRQIYIEILQELRVLFVTDPVFSIKESFKDWFDLKEDVAGFNEHFVKESVQGLEEIQNLVIEKRDTFVRKNLGASDIYFEPELMDDLDDLISEKNIPDYLITAFPGQTNMVIINEGPKAIVVFNNTVGIHQGVLEKLKTKPRLIKKVILKTLIESVLQVFKNEGKSLREHHWHLAIKDSERIRPQMKPELFMGSVRDIFSPQSRIASTATEEGLIWTHEEMTKKSAEREFKNIFMELAYRKGFHTVIVRFKEGQMDEDEIPMKHVEVIFGKDDDIYSDKIPMRQKDMDILFSAIGRDAYVGSEWSVLHTYFTKAVKQALFFMNERPEVISPELQKKLDDLEDRELDGKSFGVSYKIEADPDSPLKKKIVMKIIEEPDDSYRLTLNVSKKTSPRDVYERIKDAGRYWKEKEISTGWKLRRALRLAVQSGKSPGEKMQEILGFFREHALGLVVRDGGVHDWEGDPIAAINKGRREIGEDPTYSFEKELYRMLSDEVRRPSTSADESMGERIQLSQKKTNQYTDYYVGKHQGRDVHVIAVKQHWEPEVQEDIQRFLTAQDVLSHPGEWIILNEASKYPVEDQTAEVKWVTELATQFGITLEDPIIEYDPSDPEIQDSLLDQNIMTEKELFQFQVFKNYIEAYREFLQELISDQIEKDHETIVKEAILSAYMKIVERTRQTKRKSFADVRLEDVLDVLHSLSRFSADDINRWSIAVLAESNKLTYEKLFKRLDLRRDKKNVLIILGNLHLPAVGQDIPARQPTLVTLDSWSELSAQVKEDTKNIKSTEDFWDVLGNLKRPSKDDSSRTEVQEEESMTQNETPEKLEAVSLRPKAELEKQIAYQTKRAKEIFSRIVNAARNTKEFEDLFKDITGYSLLKEVSDYWQPGIEVVKRAHQGLENYESSFHLYLGFAENIDDHKLALALAHEYIHDLLRVSRHEHFQKKGRSLEDRLQGVFWNLRRFRFAKRQIAKKHQLNEFAMDSLGFFLAQQAGFELEGRLSVLDINAIPEADYIKRDDDILIAQNIETHPTPTQRKSYLGGIIKALKNSDQKDAATLKDIIATHFKNITFEKGFEVPKGSSAILAQDIQRMIREEMEEESMAAIEHLVVNDKNFVPTIIRATIINRTTFDINEDASMASDEEAQEFGFLSKEYIPRPEVTATKEQIFHLIYKDDNKTPIKVYPARGQMFFGDKEIPLSTLLTESSEIWQWIIQMMIQWGNLMYHGDDANLETFRKNWEITQWKFETVAQQGFSNFLDLPTLIGQNLDLSYRRQVWTQMLGPVSNLETLDTITAIRIPMNLKINGVQVNAIVLDQQGRMLQGVKENPEDPQSKIVVSFFENVPQQLKVYLSEIMSRALKVDPTLKETWNSIVGHWKKAEQVSPDESMGVNEKWVDDFYADRRSPSDQLAKSVLKAMIQRQSPEHRMNLAQRYLMDQDIDIEENVMWRKTFDEVIVELVDMFGLPDSMVERIQDHTLIPMGWEFSEECGKENIASLAQKRDLHDLARQVSLQALTTPFFFSFFIARDSEDTKHVILISAYGDSQDVLAEATHTLFEEMMGIGMEIDLAVHETFDFMTRIAKNGYVPDPRLGEALDRILKTLTLEEINARNRREQLAPVDNKMLGIMSSSLHKEILREATRSKVDAEFALLNDPNIISHKIGEKLADGFIKRVGTPQKAMRILGQMLSAPKEEKMIWSNDYEAFQEVFENMAVREDESMGVWLNPEERKHTNVEKPIADVQRILRLKINSIENLIPEILSRFDEFNQLVKNKLHEHLTLKGWIELLNSDLIEDWQAAQMFRKLSMRSYGDLFKYKYLEEDELFTILDGLKSKRRSAISEYLSKMIELSVYGGKAVDEKKENQISVFLDRWNRFQKGEIKIELRKLSGKEFKKPLEIISYLPFSVHDALQVLNREDETENLKLIAEILMKDYIFHSVRQTAWENL